MQKRRHRERLRRVDGVIDTVTEALQKAGLGSIKELDRWHAEMPREEDMSPKDKYTVFDRKERTYRKGIHSEWAETHSMLKEGTSNEPTEIPKWTRTTQRINPPGY